MKRNITTIALVCALATMTFVACEKETTENNNASQEQTQAQSIMLAYEIDGVAYQKTFNSRESLVSFLSNLLDLSLQGHQVRVYSPNGSDAIAAKEVVHFESKDKKEYAEWEATMLEQGYGVETVYNEKTGTWHGTAYKK